MKATKTMSMEKPPEITNGQETTPGIGPRNEEERLALAEAIRAALEENDKGPENTTQK